MRTRRVDRTARMRMDVDGIHVGRGLTPGPMTRRRNRKVYTGLGQQDSTRNSARTRRRDENETRRKTDTRHRPSRHDIYYERAHPIPSSPMRPARPRALQSCAPYALRFGVVTWRTVHSNWNGLRARRTEGRCKTTPSLKKIGRRPATD